MRSRNFLLAGAALAALLATDLLVRWRQGAPASTPADAPAFAALAAKTSPDGALPEVEIPFTPEGSAEARDAILAAGDRVYLGGMFRESDSLVRRWDPARMEQLRVAYVTDDLPDWTTDHRDIVRRAFTEWEGVGANIRFTEVLDTTGADIVVRWIRQFDIDRAGQADLTWDGTGRIQHADIKLALISPGGRFLVPDKLRAIALHEIGHALGLPHSDLAGDLMFPTADHPIITARDSTTFRLLYRLPPASIKWRASDSSLSR
jgi:hypothetical protein